MVVDQIDPDAHSARHRHPEHDLGPLPGLAVDLYCAADSLDTALDRVCDPLAVGRHRRRVEALALIGDEHRHLVLFGLEVEREPVGARSAWQH